MSYFTYFICIMWRKTPMLSFAFVLRHNSSGLSSVLPLIIVSMDWQRYFIYRKNLITFVDIASQLLYDEISSY